MSVELAFTGERYVPGAALGEIVYEHVHRYAFARGFAAGRSVLDVACGAGYGSAMLAESAKTVLGVDIDAEAVAHARERYGAKPNLSFLTGSASALPLAAGGVDMVVSFETLEHLPRAEQPRMLAEFARVLTPHGLLVLSVPNPREYSDARGYRNPFHLHEPDRTEMERLLEAFPARRWYRQRLWLGSALWAEGGGREGAQASAGFEAWNGGQEAARAAGPPEAMYFVVLAAREESALPPGPSLSLFSDAEETELRRTEHQAREVIRLDQLALAQQAAAASHAERADALAGTLQRRDQDVAQAVADLASARQAAGALEAERERLEAALAAQERIIAYRQSAGWWLRLPWFRVRLWLRALTGS